MEGRHKVRVTAPGHKVRTLTLSVVGGKFVRHQITLEPLPRPRFSPLLRRRIIPPRQVAPKRRAAKSVSPTPFYKRAWFWTIVGAVVVGAGATTGYFIWQGAQTDRKYDDNLLLR